MNAKRKGRWRKFLTDGPKRNKTQEKGGATEVVRKKQRVDDRPMSARHRSLPDSENFSEESSGDTTSDEKTYKERPVFDDLLKALSSGSQSRYDAYKLRQREQEEASGTEDENSGSEYTGSSEEENGKSDNESGQDSRYPLKRKHKSVVEHEGDDETFNDKFSNSDHEESEESDDGDTSDESDGESTSHDHFGVTLKSEEVDELMKKSWKFKWEMPVIDSALSKWVGTGECFLKDVDSDKRYGLLPKLYNHWLKEYKAFGGNDFHSSRQRQFFSLCNSYRDIMHCSKKPFYFKGTQEDSDIMDSYIMHAINHVFRTRDLVIKNDAKLAKDQDTAKEELLNGNDFRDQGFTRPKVLFLLPYRSFGLRLVRRLIHLAPLSKKGNVEHLSRFYDEFGTDDGKDEDVDDMVLADGHGAEDSKSRQSAKPEDHQVLFGGNNDDCFMMGIKFTRRSIKLYGDFYSSDMIVASPLGLSKKIAETTIDKEKDVDYLSSIEVLIIDHADVIAMQNWSHLTTVIEQLNHLPSKQHRTDFMRVRQWYLEGQSRFYRQTILLSDFLNPDMNSLFNHHCFNHEGKVKMMYHHKGVLPKILLPVKQVYERFNASSIDVIDDARFDYFVKKVYPKIKDSIQGGIMLFISSYLDFVRVRNFLKSQDASFCLLGEYTKQSDISRARVWFFQGTRKIMLYTERAHFYHRYKIRGIQNLCVYSLPERKDFYPELLNMLGEAKNAMCNVLFSRFDLLRLERIVGTAAGKRMVSSDKSMFVFS
ncbi:unnamed protein product [Spirodela intermedia]|uniref:Uncharacterized protein n=1 Tax=Spirodela intermedia TaxID=51605 RepID=A0A7I8KLV7_SPIIN|nr:unnamed protein product [Spirodela intermedia]